MKRFVLFLVVLALAACSAEPETQAIERYLDQLRPQFAPHKVTDVMRRDSAACPLPELQRALDFYKSQEEDFASRLQDINDARSKGDGLTVQIAKLAALDAAASVDATAPLGWPNNARDSAFVRVPKDCIGIECRYSRSGASADESVFYLSDGKVVFSNTELVDRLPEVFDAFDAVGAAYSRIMQ